LFCIEGFVNGAQRSGAQPPGLTEPTQHSTVKMQIVCLRYLQPPCQVGCSAWLGKVFL